MINKYLTGCGEITLPELPTDFDCGLSPLLSQVCGLLILPKGAPGPSSWVVASDMEAIIDNTVTDNSAGKWIVGRGGIEKPQEIIITQGKRSRKVSQRLYTLTYEVNIRTNGIYNFLQTLQTGYKHFNFWHNTLGGRLFGGQSGICPDFVTAWTVYSDDPDEVERGFIQLQWYADGDPTRTNAVINPSGGGGGSPSPITDIMFYQQSFAAAASSALLWTQNSGVLPTTNTAAQLLVFQNGQKLEETVQYSISHLTGPGESTITIDATTHFSGANYEVLSVITS